MVSTVNIHTNRFFQSHSLNQMNESSSKLEQQDHNSLFSSRSRSRSSSTDRQVIISSSKHREEYQNRKVQREKFIREKELIFKRQSSSISKFKHHRSSSDRRESKEEKLKRLYNQYSDEDIFKHGKPLLLNDCFELYEYAFDKYYRTS